VRGLLFFLILALFSIWVLQASGTFESILYKERQGVIVVEKVRYEWHPDRLVPFLKQLPKKTSDVLNNRLSRLRRKEAIPEGEGGGYP